MGYISRQHHDRVTQSKKWNEIDLVSSCGQITVDQFIIIVETQISKNAYLPL